MNTPIPFIEEAVKEFAEKFYVKEQSGIFSKVMDEKIADFLRSKLTLALEKGKKEGGMEAFNYKQVFEAGEAAGRKAACDYIAKNVWYQDRACEERLKQVMNHIIQASNE